MASRKANPAVIGAFVIGATALAVVGALLFGSGRFFQETTPWVIYFDSSVVGLDVGSPVIFRGVAVGSVVEIDVFVDAEKNIVATPVYIQLVRGSVRSPQPTPPDPVPVVKRWIEERDLRAQLKTQSLVTGKLYVDLAFHPDTPLDLKGLDPTVPEIPAIQTQLEEIEQTVRRFVRRIEKMPLEEIVDNINSAVASADALLSNPKLESAVDNLDGVLADLRELANRLTERADTIDKDLKRTVDQANVTMKRAESALVNVNNLIEPGSPVHYQVLTTLQEISEMARSIRALTDALGREPDQLIFGKGKAGDDG